MRPSVQGASGWQTSELDVLRIRLGVYDADGISGGGGGCVRHDEGKWRGGGKLIKKNIKEIARDNRGGRGTGRVEILAVYGPVMNFYFFLFGSRSPERVSGYTQQEPPYRNGGVAKYPERW